MPKNSSDGFNPIHCWQHSFAVAQLSEHLCKLRAGTKDAKAKDANPPDASMAYLIGLCHDLGELLFREQFGPEYRTVIEAEQRTGRPRADIELEIMGLTRNDLMEIILDRFGLPEAIRTPIKEFHAPLRPTESAFVRTLRMADSLADGLMLATGPSARIGPFTKAQCREVTGSDHPTMPDAQSFRSQIVTLTCMLAKLTPPEELALSAPLYPKADVRIWLARDPGLSELDPVQVLLASLAEVTSSDRLPQPEECEGIDALVVAARTSTVKGLTATDIAKATATAHWPVLWLVGSAESSSGEAKGAPSPVRWPVALSEIAAFTQGIASSTPALQKTGSI
jgi:hypothetical protein